MNPLVNISLIMFGLMFLGILPPVGLLLLVLAWLSHRSARGRVRAAETARRSKREEQERRAFIAAMKSLP